MTYEQTIAYLYEQLPMFHRIGAEAYKPNLDNTIALMNALENPERKFKSIHIAGTNGKGSVSNMLAAILQQAGYKTGLYTSPHLLDFRERIRINGKMIDEQSVVSFVEKIKPLMETLCPSFFEITVAMAFQYFVDEQIDIAIVECGLGGRLDSTNVITPELSIITNIGLDHTALLGNTVEKIASEKAGIIKPHVPVVIGQQGEVRNVFSDKAASTKSEVIFAEEKYMVKEIRQLPDSLELIVADENEQEQIVQSALSGMYQQHNVITVLTAVNTLNKIGWNISKEVLLYALKNTTAITGFRGRWEVLNRQPLTVADIAHNVAGISAVIQQAEEVMKSKKLLHVVFGMVQDKDVVSVLKLLPQQAIYYFCQPDLPRALNADELKNKAAEVGLNGIVYSSVAAAYNSAQQAATADDFILITGSNFVVAEVLQNHGDHSLG